jgi:hypothetical protein
MQIGECPRIPEDVADFLDVGTGFLATRTVAVVTVGIIARDDSEIRALQDRATPPPNFGGPATDYALRIDEVLSGSALAAGDTVALRRGGPPGDEQFTPFPHPREGARLLLVLFPHDRDAAIGVFWSYPYSNVDISGPKAHFVDAWRTSVKEMDAPESTPAFIEAVRTALEARP